MTDQMIICIGIGVAVLSGWFIGYSHGWTDGSRKSLAGAEERLRNYFLCEEVKFLLSTNVYVLTKVERELRWQNAIVRETEGDPQ